MVLGLVAFEVWASGDYRPDEEGHHAEEVIRSARLAVSSFFENERPNKTSAEPKARRKPPQKVAADTTAGTILSGSPPRRDALSRADS